MSTVVKYIFCAIEKRKKKEKERKKRERNNPK
jgi:hypothetical protein